MSMLSLRTIRLLVVDDNPGFVYLLRRAFGDRAGRIRWDLTVAEDGEAALKMLFREEVGSAPLPDLILLDWNLPKLSGSDVLEQVKQHRRLRKIPVLVFTSSEAERDVHTAYDSHANAYITKPETSAALLAIVEAIERFWIAVAQLPGSSVK
jgi:CheY-like chemotaxis protein